MTLEDPTLAAIKAYDMSPAEAIVGLLVLIVTAVIHAVNQVISKTDGKGLISRKVVRTPESSFSGVEESPGSHYMYIHHEGQSFRIHYIDQGGYESDDVILCLHGEPFWSQSYRKLIPYLVKQGYRVIAPDYVGFGRSDKLVDWRAYSLGLHEATLEQLMLALNLPQKRVTLVGHNWGFLAGIHTMRKHPDWFDNLVILNTNNLPDGEVSSGRFPTSGLLMKYLVYDAYFLTFRSAIELLKHSFPLPFLLSALNVRYSRKEKRDFLAPFQRKQDLGGVVAFPLMVPVKPSDKYAADFREARAFLAHHWNKPTLIMYSSPAVVPFIQTGDPVVGNRRDFFKRLIPHATVAPRIPGGHLIQYDNPQAVSHYIVQFLTYGIL